MYEQLTEKQLTLLQLKVEKGAYVRTMCQGEGYKILEKRLTDKIADLKNRWLTADEEEAKKVKLRAQIYNEIIDELKKLMLEGAAATKCLKDYAEVQGE